MKQSLLCAALGLVLTCGAQTTIDEHVFGKNAQLPDSIGQVQMYGKLEKYMDPTNPSINYIKGSRPLYMRYGGIQVEQNCKLNGGYSFNTNLWKSVKDYIGKAIQMYNNNITPILTFPVDTALSGFNNPSVLAQANKELVKQVNTQLVALGRPAVTHWIYGNEPEDGGGIHNLANTVNGGRIIYKYIREIHDSVAPLFVSNTSWGAPVFIGPELYSYDNYNHGAGKVDRLIDQLTGIINPQGNCDITPYIDVFTIHSYAFGDEADTATVANGGNIIPATKSNVVNFIRNGCNFANTNPAMSLKSQIDSLQLKLSGTGVKVGITEMNLCHLHDVNGTGNVADAQDLTPTGTSANSFLAGQYWAETMSLAMEKGVFINFWSAIEGDSATNYRSDVGYLYSDKTKTEKRKPTYWHFKMLSDNFRGRYFNGTYNLNGASEDYANAGIRVFAGQQDAGIKIMILNHSNTSYPYRVNFGGSGTTSGKVSFDFPSTMTSTFTMQQTVYQADSAIKPKSTTLLTFDCHGNFISRQVYTEQDAINETGPHMKQIGTVYLDPEIIACDLGGGIGGALNGPNTWAFDTIVVNSDITLTTGASLNVVNCLVIMSEGTQILGAGDNPVYIKNSVFLGCGETQWEGITLSGAWHPTDSLRVEDSYFINANIPLTTNYVYPLNVLRNVFVHGDNALDMSHSKGFHIDQNLIVDYTNGIKTTNTESSYASTIYANKMFCIDNGMSFNGDGHDGLDIFCNSVRFRDYGVLGTGTNLKNQGDASFSAGNKFYNETAGEPVQYVELSGSSPTYYYGPSQIYEYTGTDVMNITYTQASADRECPLDIYASDCPNWIPDGIDEKNIAKEGMLVYPNPSNGVFTLKTQKKGEYDLHIYDLLGHEVLSKKINEQEIKFELKNQGLYIITLQNENERLTKKIVVE